MKLANRVNGIETSEVRWSAIGMPRRRRIRVTMNRKAFFRFVNLAEENILMTSKLEDEFYGEENERLNKAGRIDIINKAWNAKNDDDS